MERESELQMNVTRVYLQVCVFIHIVALLSDTPAKD